MIAQSSAALLKNWHNLSPTMLERLGEYKARLDVALHHPPSAKWIRQDRAEALAEGFDPKTLWDQAVNVNQDSNFQAPTWEDVAPSPVEN